MGFIIRSDLFNVFLMLRGTSFSVSRDVFWFVAHVSPAPADRTRFSDYTHNMKTISEQLEVIISKVARN